MSGTYGGASYGYQSYFVGATAMVLAGSAAGFQRVVSPEVPWEPVEVFTGEPIIGWRVWQIGDPGSAAEQGGWRGMLKLIDEARRLNVDCVELAEQPILLPYARGRAWPSRKRYEAECLQGHDKPPAFGCGCGLWAFKDLETLRQRFATNLTWFVCGTVALWGRIVECADGYRAQYAYPQELELVTVDPDGEKPQRIAQRLADAYGIPCVPARPWDKASPVQPPLVPGGSVPPALLVPPFQSP